LRKSFAMRRYLALAGLLLAAPAAAQDRPQLTPTRDVAVTYRQIGASAPQGMPPIVIAWNAASGLMRSEMAGIGWSVVDMRAGRGFLVMEQMRTIMDMPAGQLAVLPGQSPKASFRREGTATVAGLPCTIWFVQDGPSQGRACITADGVTLRADGTHQGQSGGLEATQVRFAPQDPARFQRPQGYQAMQGMPGMPPAARQPGR
jgi:hypothetical protein